MDHMMPHGAVRQSKCTATCAQRTSAVLHPAERPSGHRSRSKPVVPPSGTRRRRKRCCRTGGSGERGGVHTYWREEDVVQGAAVAMLQGSVAWDSLCAGARQAEWPSEGCERRRQSQHQAYAHDKHPGRLLFGRPGKRSGCGAKLLAVSRLCGHLCGVDICKRKAV